MIRIRESTRDSLHAATIAAPRARARTSCKYIRVVCAVVLQYALLCKKMQRAVLRQTVLPRRGQQLRRVQGRRTSRPVAHPRHHVQTLTSFDIDDRLRAKLLTVAMSAAQRQPTKCPLQLCWTRSTSTACDTSQEYRISGQAGNLM